MKKIIALLMFGMLLAGCGSSSSSSQQITASESIEDDSPSILHKGTNGDISYDCEDLGNRIPYESGTVAIQGIYFLEKKNGAYIDTSAIVIIDLSDLTEDERVWFSDEITGGLVSKVRFKLYIPRNDSLDSFRYISGTTGTMHDGKDPVYMIFYSMEGEKHSLEGEEYAAYFYVPREDNTDTYLYIKQIELATSERLSADGLQIK